MDRPLAPRYRQDGRADLEEKTQKEMDRPLDPWYKHVRGSPGPLGKNKNLENKYKRRWIGHWSLGIDRMGVQT